MSVGQRLLHMPLLLLLYSLLLGIALVPAQSALMTMMQLAVPDLKRGRVGSALNALTTAAGLLSMATAAVLGEIVQLRMIYAIAGLITSAAGVVALFVLVEPDAQPGEAKMPRTNEGVEVAVPAVAEAEAK
jgi:MFS family permease